MSFTEGERLEAVKVQDKYGQTVLHYVAKNPESLKMVLELLPEGERLEAVKVQDKVWPNGIALCLQIKP